MACRTMQLRFLKLGTVLTYAFNLFVRVRFVFFATDEHVSRSVGQAIMQGRQAKNFTQKDLATVSAT